jgi:PHD/YefM family antitoxin component YafN of YafNO toxin-antitoxin module
LVFVEVMKPAAKASPYAQSRSPAKRVKENGVAAYLVEAKSYEAMQKRLQLLEGLARGEKALADGRVVSHSRAKKRLARWLK